MLFSKIKTGGYKQEECAKIMINPFMALTNWSVDRPRTAFATILLVVFMLASGAMHLQFDNSEDGFFPDDPSVDLLNEVESEYRSNIDFIRVISEINEGDLLNQSTWEQLAGIEATMLSDENFSDYHYPLFGTQANNGPAGQAMQWMILHDEVMANTWLTGLESSLIEVMMASDDANLSAALQNLSTAAATVLEVEPVTPQRLLDWDASNPAVWLPRLDSGANLSDELGQLMGQLASAPDNRSAAQAGQIAAVTGPLQAQLGPLLGLQSIDFRASILSCLPTDDAEDPWNSDGPVMVTLVVLGRVKKNIGVDLIHHLHLLDHHEVHGVVRMQDHVDTNLAHFKEVLLGQTLEDVGMRVVDELEKLGAMQVFHRRLVVVPEGQLVRRLREEDVVNAQMIYVMANGADKERVTFLLAEEVLGGA